MIRITDMTLCCLDEYDPSPEQLKELTRLLFEAGVDCVELPADTYRKIGEPNDGNSFLLRMKRAEDIKLYPGVRRYICRRRPVSYSDKVTEEIQANDRSVIEKGKATQCEEVIPWGDGCHTYVSLKFPLLDPSGVPYAVGGVSTDITPLKEAQEALQRANTELEQRVELFCFIGYDEYVEHIKCRGTTDEGRGTIMKG